MVNEPNKPPSQENLALGEVNINYFPKILPTK